MEHQGNHPIYGHHGHSFDSAAINIVTYALAFVALCLGAVVLGFFVLTAYYFVKIAKNRFAAYWGDPTRSFARKLWEFVKPLPFR